MRFFRSAVDRHAKQLAEQALYERAAVELSSGSINKGLYAKALALSGDPERASAMYLRLRVESLAIEDAARAEIAAMREREPEPEPVYLPAPSYEREPWSRLLLHLMLTLAGMGVLSFVLWAYMRP